MTEHPFTWYSLLPHPLNLLPEHTFTALLAMVVVVMLALTARGAAPGSKDRVIPDERLSVRNLMEFLVGLVVSLSDGVIGKKGRKYVSLFGSFFLFILVANLLGLVPGFSPPTSNLNTTLGLALVSFAAYNFFGFKEHGFGYLKQFIGPMTSLPATSKKILSLLFAPVLLLSIGFFFILEGSSHLFRPVSLSLRLFGNMFGDHQVLEAFMELTKIAVPVLFYALGALVSVIQAFVFTILSVIYVALAISHEH
jgi:F-type H+-transporting ATPase subunit a